MTQPLQSYGFTYEHKGTQFAFDVLATNKEEAEARIAALAKANSIGALHLQVDTTADS